MPLNIKERDVDIILDRNNEIIYLRGSDLQFIEDFELNIDLVEILNTSTKSSAGIPKGYHIKAK